MRKSNKKGFTIVELVIVIAVIAILAAVLIPTFISLTKKANQSADVQTVRNMNTALTIQSAEGKPDSLLDVLSALSAQQIEADNCHPITSGAQFYWVKSENRIVYAELDGDTKTVLYPEDCKNLTYAAGDWFVLDGSIEKTPIDYKTAVINGELKIGSAGELAQFAADFSSGSVNEVNSVTKIELSADIYLDGAEISIKNDQKDLEIDGNNHTIYGLRVSEPNKFVGDKKPVANEFGFIASVGRNKTVTIKNVTFDGANIGASDRMNGTKFAVIAGNVSGTLNVENVTIKNSSVRGYQKVGAVVGMASPGSTVSLNNVKFENVQVSGLYQTAKIVGYADGMYQNTTPTKVTYTGTTGDGITVELNEAAYKAGKAEVNWTEFTVGGISSYVIAPYVIYKSGENVYYNSTVTDELAWAYSENVGTYTYENTPKAISVKPTSKSINNSSSGSN